MVTFWNLTNEQYKAYKELQNAEILAHERMKDYLNSLLPEPLTSERRREMMHEIEEEYVSNTVYAGFGGETAREMMDDMSDWELTNVYEDMIQMRREDEDEGEY